MHKFNGFKNGEERKVWLPEGFFSDLLPLVDDLAELKITLFALWALHQKEGDFRYLRRRDFASSSGLMNGLQVIYPEADTDVVLDLALQQAIEHGILLFAEISQTDSTDTLYFANTPRGREAVEKIQQGGWKPGDLHNPVEVLPTRPTIFQLYEDNIGPLTPMIAERLKDAGTEYPPAWLEEAIQIAVERNARNWRYIRAILERWQTNGKDDGRLEKYDEQDSARYISGQFAAFVTYKPDDE